MSNIRFLIKVANIMAGTGNSSTGGSTGGSASATQPPTGSSTTPNFNTNTQNNNTTPGFQGNQYNSFGWNFQMPTWQNMQNTVGNMFSTPYTAATGNTASSLAGGAFDFTQNQIGDYVNKQITGFANTALNTAQNLWQQHYNQDRSGSFYQPLQNVRGWVNNASNVVSGAQKFLKPVNWMLDPQHGVLHNFQGGAFDAGRKVLGAANKGLSSAGTALKSVNKALAPVQAGYDVMNLGANPTEQSLQNAQASVPAAVATAAGVGAAPLAVGMAIGTGADKVRQRYQDQRAVQNRLSNNGWRSQWAASSNPVAATIGTVAQLPGQMWDNAKAVYKGMAAEGAKDFKYFAGSTGSKYVDSAINHTIMPVFELAKNGLTSTADALTKFMVRHGGVSKADGAKMLYDPNDRKQMSAEAQQQQQQPVRRV